MMLKALVLLMLASQTSGFNFTQSGGSFSVALKGLMLLQQSPDSPCVYVGKVTTVFNEFLGNFHIKQSIDERIGLSKFQWTPANNTLLLSYADFWMSLAFTGDADGNGFNMDVTGMSDNINQVWIRLVAPAGERVYGGGEQFSYFNMKGHSFPIWTREQGVGRNLSTLATFFANNRDGGGGDYHTTYFPQPTFISSRKYYFHYTGSNYAKLDFSKSYHEISFYETPISTMRFATAPSLKGLVSGLISMLGKVAELPDWIYDGAVIGVQGGTQKMMDYIDLAEAHGLKLTGVWIQDWSGTIYTSFGQRVFWDWKWNPDRYPGLDKTINTLKARGIRVFVYVNPNLNANGTLFKQADAKGYFIQNSQGKTLVQNFGEFYCGTIDLTNPEAFEWYKNEILIKNVINFGFGGWMADFGEYTPAYATLHNGTATMRHNEWPTLWARMNREALQETGTEGDIVFFMRAGFTGTGNYSVMMWAGDQNVDFSYADGLASTIPAALSMGITSHGLTHFDIGGYTTSAAMGLVRTEERLLRGAEHAVFGPMFRTHEGNQPTANVQFYSNKWITVKMARLCQMFTLLKNYSKNVVHVTSQTGIPAQRPLLLNYEDDVNTYDVTYQYMYGDDLLVAPVFLANQTQWDVYLPNDPNSNWIFLWTGKEYAGSQTVKVNAAVGQPPVFYRKISPYSAVFQQIGNFSLVVTPSTPHPTGPTSHPTSPSTCSAGFITFSFTLGFLSLFFALKALF
ncbi:sulfoquinovosidase-like isoform X2 [Haliotis asinina]